MTISSEHGRQSYQGAGTTGPFAVPFKFFDASDLKVVKQSADGTDATLTLNVDYTVTGAGSDLGGTVTTTVAVESGETLSIILDPPLTQLTDYVSNDAFPAESHERALDRVTQQNIRARDMVERALRLPDGDYTVMPELPGAAARAGKFLRFADVTGHPEMAVGIDQSQTLSQSVIGGLLNPQTAAEATAGVTPTDTKYPPSVDERRFGAAFPLDPDAVADVLASAREEDIPRVPVRGSVAQALRPIVSYSDRTVYVDPVNGDDGNDGSSSSPLATIQEAINRCPIYLYHHYKISLAEGTYDEDVLISNVHCFTRGTSKGFISQNLEIIGADIAPADPSSYKVGSVTIIGCHGLAAVYLQGLQMQRVKPYYESAAAIGIFGSGELLARNISFAAAVGAAGGAGIRVYGARGSLREINCTNVTNGVWAKRSAFVMCSDFSGTPSAQVYRSEEASIVVFTNDATKKATITGATSASPIVFTTDEPHGFATGEVVEFAFLPGDFGTNLNGTSEAVTALSSTTFSVAVDGSGYAAYTSGGTAESTDPRRKFVTNGGRIFNLSGDEFRDSREVAIGLPASVTDALGTDAVRIGYNTEASSTQAVSIGAGAKASSGTNNIALGGGSTANGNDAAIAIGASSTAGRRAVAIGRATTASGENSVAIGNGSSATSDNSGSIMGGSNGVAGQIRVGTGGTHTVVLALAATAPADADMPNNTVAFYISSGNLGIKIKDGSGTSKTGTVTLT